MTKFLPLFSVYALGTVYIIAGFNHFINPEYYLPLIPDYIPYHSFFNYASGIGEILAGISVLIPFTRKSGCNAILFLLIAFLPAHIYFIQKNGYLSDAFCVPAWVAWIRLLIIHPVLLYWAYNSSKIK